MQPLAIEGGRPVRPGGFPARTPYAEDDLRELREALEAQDLFYTANNKCAAFEREFAGMYAAKYAITCSSGTAAVHMAVAALGADPGAEVITAPVTDFGTVAGILFQGLVPIFADWKPGTFNMDPAAVERLVNERTRAIVAVHLFGNPCDLDALSAIARRHRIALIEDCSQAYLTRYRGNLVGTVGDIGTFSMQQSKHLPTGEGGVTITNNDDYAMRMTLFRDKGWENRGKWGPRSYTFLGLNYRMNELTAAVARAQLRRLDHVVSTMHQRGEALTQMLRDIPGLAPAPVTPGGEHSYWLYPFTITGYDAPHFVDALKAEGLPVGYGYTGKPIYLCTDALTRKRTFGESNYPFDVHRQGGGNVQYHEGLCPVAERELKQLGVFRIFETWTDADMRDVATIFHKVADGMPPAKQ